jgi:coenzyme Q-binding protein COQ10
VTQHSESRIVPYTADLMYAVVADVERYPDFVPGVKALHVAGRSRDGEREMLSARMTAGFRNFSESYTSRVTLDRQARTIDVVQTEGPFRRLENHWRFTPQDAGCKVDFSITFEFRNPVLNMVAGAAFGRMMLKMTDAFLERARKLSKKTA